MAVNTPNSIREPPATGEPTAPYRPGSGQPGEPPRPIQVELIPGSSPQSVGDLERLLRKRLRVIVLIISAFYAAQLVRSVATHFQWLTGPPPAGSDLGFYVLILATAAGLAGVLCSGRALALRSLRAIELSSISTRGSTILGACYFRADA